MRIFLTGASGIVGAELARKLLVAGHDVTALIHRKAAIIGNDGRPVADHGGRLRFVAGDVSAPGLGLGRDGCDALAAAERIVHAGAVTEFGMPTEAYMTINYGGTRHVGALAEAHRIPLVYVSTAYVCGYRSGVVEERLAATPPRFGNPYEESKFLAEQWLAGHVERFVVARPSIVVGTGASGRIREFRQIYTLLKVLTRGWVRSIPGEFPATLNIVPVDYVAAALFGLALQAEDEFDRSVYHLVGARNLTFQDMSDVLAEYPAFEVPRYLPPHVFDTDDLPRKERRFYDTVVSLYETYFVRRLDFHADNVGRIGLHSPLGGPVLFRRIIDHAEKVGFLTGS